MDDFLYARTLYLWTRFESALQKHFNIGKVESESFSSIGPSPTQDKSGSVTTEASDKLMDVQPISIIGNDQTKGDFIAAVKEVAACIFFIRKQLYISRLISPIIAFHASSSATKSNNLQLHHIPVLKNTLKTILIYAVTVIYLHSVGWAFNLKTMWNASMREAQGKPNVREGVLVIWRCAES